MMHRQGWKVFGKTVATNWCCGYGKTATATAKLWLRIGAVATAKLLRQRQNCGYELVLWLRQNCYGNGKTVATNWCCEKKLREKCLKEFFCPNFLNVKVNIRKEGTFWYFPIRAVKTIGTTWAVPLFFFWRPLKSGECKQHPTHPIVVQDFFLEIKQIQLIFFRFTRPPWHCLAVPLIAGSPSLGTVGLTVGFLKVYRKLNCTF